MRQAAMLAGTALLLMAAGCQSIEAGHDLPARIVNADDASRAELQMAVNQALGTTVTLAPDALTTSGTLIIERNPPGGINAPATQGRNMEVPIQFWLVKNGKSCVLIDQRDKQRYSLPTTDCVVE